ncbi:MAG TPA: hypothetical protein VNQ90_18580 [Chthoniobacteraceae bacterium]|nr:hypothetical protein [Chthoniobacteraceae bacterium]
MKFKTIALCLLLASPLNAEELKLMFGNETSRPETQKFLDFRYATPDAPEFAPKSKIANSWIYTPSESRPGSLPADVLLEHHLWCQDATLELPCSWSEATVTVWIGDWNSGWRRFWQEKEIRLEANGQVVHQQELNPQSAYDEWCRLEEYVFSKNDGIWERIVEPILTKKTFTVKPVDGKINLKLKNILLTAITVNRTPEEAAATAKKIEEERRKQFAERYPWQPPADEPMPELSPEVRKRGYLLFQKYSEDKVHPWSRPSGEEVTDTVRVFAARDEQEIFRFGILPLHDLPDLTVEVGDFVGEGGKLETAANADLWRERYKEQGSRETKGIIRSMRQLDPLSYVLQEMKPQHGETGTPRMFTLDFRVPPSAQAGDYFAPLTILSGKKVIGTARLQLKVLPFALIYKGAATYNFTMGYSHWADWWGAKREPDEMREVMRRQSEFPYKYRFNTNQFNPWGWKIPSIFPLGKIDGAPGQRRFTQTPEQQANFDWWIDRFRKDPECRYIELRPFALFANCGLRINIRETPENPDLVLKDIEDLTRQIDQMCKKRGYPEIYWYYEGEIDNRGIEHVKYMIRVGEAVKRAGATSYVTINGPLAYKMTPPVYEHIWANPATPIDESLLATIRQYGHKFGSHNSGDSRFQAGFWFWRTGGEGRYQETSISYANYMLPYCLLPWNYNTSLVYPDPKTHGQRPSLQFLNYRDGRDDYLYLYTLEQTLKEAASGTPAYAAAEQFLAEMKDRIHVDQRKYHTATFDGIEGTAEVSMDEWNNFSIERFRWKIATLITNLQEANR